MAHQLKIRAFSDPLNPSFLFVKDLSVWDEQLEILNRKLIIYPSFSSDGIEMLFPINDEIGYNGKDFNYGINASESPDGYYRLHYSVSPNDAVFAEVHYYHTAKLQQEFLKRVGSTLALDKVTTDSCGNLIYTKEQRALANVSLIIQSLSAAVNNKQFREANDLYNWAWNLVIRTNSNIC